MSNYEVHKNTVDSSENFIELAKIARSDEARERWVRNLVVEIKRTLHTAGVKRVHIYLNPAETIRAHGEVYRGSLILKGMWSGTFDSRQQVAGYLREHPFFAGCEISASNSVDVELPEGV